MLVDELLRHRLANHRLAEPAACDPAEVVTWLAAVQSQDYPGGCWGVGLRLVAANDAAVGAAFDAGRILRTHVLRPTWHFVAPADLRWLLALTGPRVVAAMRTMDRQLGVDEALYARSNRAIAAALANGEHMTRADVGAALGRAGIAAEGQILGHLVMHAELEALICSGPRRGKQHTYALVEARVPPAAPLERDEAVAELVGRYFTSHGPATAADFAWWSGLTVADARRGLAANGARFVHEVVDGREYWLEPRAAPAVPERAYLLPNYDEYTVAYRDRDAFFDPRHAVGRDPRQWAPFANVVVVDGRVVGIWQRALRRDAVEVALRWLEPPDTGTLDLVEAAARRYADFLGLPLQLVSDAPR